MDRRCRGSLQALRTAFCAVLLLLAVSVHAQASDLDDALAAARNQGRFVLLELGYPGCKPCDDMQPIMARLSREYKGRIEVIFIDVRNYPGMKRRFRVYAIPTLVFLDSTGREFHRHIGYYEYDKIVSALKKGGI
jgi:thiol-disulfide isomerase/thioredoxin